MAEISVIMGVYNQSNKEQLEAAVISILNQSFKDIELIIYDDGSEKSVAKHLVEIAKTDDRIVLLRCEDNNGLAFSLNACIDKSTGKYIARMDADDISRVDRLEKQKAYLDKNKDVDWVGCNAELFDDDGVWGKRKMPEHPEPTDFLRFSPYIHPSVMYRKDTLIKNQGYSTREEMLRCEDYEIFMRLTKLGFKGANIQEYLFKYRENNSSFKKRTVKYRFNEAKCRYKNFKELGILFPKGWVYVLRPIVACIVPTRIIRFQKNVESKKIDSEK